MHDSSSDSKSESRCSDAELKQWSLSYGVMIVLLFSSVGLFNAYSGLGGLDIVRSIVVSKLLVWYLANI